MAMEDSRKTWAISRGLIVVGSGLLFWYAMFGYLNRTYGPGAPYYLGNRPVENNPR